MFAIRAAHGFDGESHLSGRVTVLVDAGRIVGIESAPGDLPVDVEVIDHGDATVLPGLIDTHVHLLGDGSAGALDRVAGYTDDEIEAVVTAALERQLAAGVTTVRDLGDRDFAAVRRRDAQRRSDDGLPLILAAGPPITTSGGHCASFGTPVAAAEEIRRAVRNRVEWGVDAVKVMASGGIMTAGTDIFASQFSLAQLRVLVDTAHEAGLPVIAHAHPAAAISMALDAGADGIEHASYLDRSTTDIPEGIAALTSFGASDEELGRLAAAGIPVCPTLGGLSAPTTVPPGLNQLLTDSGMTIGEVIEMRRTLIRRMHRAEVRLIGGMDAGISPAKAHGRYAESVIDMAAVMPAGEALAASTSMAAEALGLGDRKGRLSPGYDADLLVVAGDLANDLASLRDVREVVLRGRQVVLRGAPAHAGLQDPSEP